MAAIRVQIVGRRGADLEYSIPTTSGQPTRVVGIAELQAALRGRIAPGDIEIVDASGQVVASLPSAGGVGDTHSQSRVDQFYTELNRATFDIAGAGGVPRIEEPTAPTGGLPGLPQAGRRGRAELGLSDLIGTTTAAPGGTAEGGIRFPIFWGTTEIRSQSELDALALELEVPSSELLRQIYGVDLPDGSGGGGAPGLDPAQIENLLASAELTRGQAALLERTHAEGIRQFQESLDQLNRQDLGALISNLLTTRQGDVSSARRETNVLLERSVAPEVAERIGSLFGFEGAFPTRETAIDEDIFRSLDIDEESRLAEDSARDILGLAEGGLIRAQGGSVSELEGFDDFLEALLGSIGGFGAFATTGEIPADLANRLLGGLTGTEGTFTDPLQTLSEKDRLDRVANFDRTFNADQQQRMIDNELRSKGLDIEAIRAAAANTQAAAAQLQAQNILEAARVDAAARIESATIQADGSIRVATINREGNIEVANIQKDGMITAAKIGAAEQRLATQVNERLGLLQEQRLRASEAARLAANPRKIFEALSFQANLKPTEQTAELQDELTGGVTPESFMGVDLTPQTPDSAPIEGLRGGGVVRRANSGISIREAVDDIASDNDIIDMAKEGASQVFTIRRAQEGALVEETIGGEIPTQKRRNKGQLVRKLAQADPQAVSRVAKRIRPGGIFQSLSLAEASPTFLGRAAKGKSVTGPAILLTGEGKNDEGLTAGTAEFVLAAPGTVVAPMQPGDKPDMVTARRRIFEQVAKTATGGVVTSKKARKILRHGSVKGKPLSEKQKGMFGLIAGGGTPTQLEDGGVIRAVEGLLVGDTLRDVQNLFNDPSLSNAQRTYRLRSRFGITDLDEARDLIDRSIQAVAAQAEASGPTGSDRYIPIGGGLYRDKVSGRTMNEAAVRSAQGLPPVVTDPVAGPTTSGSGPSTQTAFERDRQRTTDEMGNPIGTEQDEVDQLLDDVDTAATEQESQQLSEEDLDAKIKSLIDTGDPADLLEAINLGRESRGLPPLDALPTSPSTAGADAVDPESGTTDISELLKVAAEEVAGGLAETFGQDRGRLVEDIMRGSELPEALSDTQFTAQGIAGLSETQRGALEGLLSLNAIAPEDFTAAVGREFRGFSPTRKSGQRAKFTSILG